MEVRGTISTEVRGSPIPIEVRGSPMPSVARGSPTTAEVRGSPMPKNNPGEKKGKSKKSCHPVWKRGGK
jgi:hypothetical protein